MVYLSKIYTRTGDDGTTALGDGTRVPKTDARIEAYGTADELGAVIGLAATHTDDADLLARIRRIQNDLFDLGADLCVPESEAPPEHPPLRIHASQVKRLETEIDELNENLAPLKSFVLSGGSALGAGLHHARTVARRGERAVLRLAATEQINVEVVHYLNRLSDYLFVMARFANRDGDTEVLWQPGGSRASGEAKS